MGLKPIDAADLGKVLISMSDYARERARYHGNVGDRNAALVYTLAFVLQAGAAKCLDIAQEQVAEGEANDCQIP